MRRTNMMFSEGRKESQPQSGMVSAVPPGIARYYGPLLITGILLAGQISFGILDSYMNLVIAVGVSVATELLLSRIINGTWKNPASAYISGISVGILIRSTMVWPYVVTAMLSIISKYILRYRGRHIWNPSNFGISWMLFTAPATVAGLSIQWGNNLWAMIVIWLLGMVIVWRAHRLHITLSYVVGFLFFSFLRSLLTGDPFLTEAAPLTGPMYQLFIFFMITDPATTVRNKKGQVAVALLIAFVEFVLRLNHLIYAPFYALFLVGPAAMVLELTTKKKRDQV